MFSIRFYAYFFVFSYLHFFSVIWMMQPVQQKCIEDLVQPLNIFIKKSHRKNTKNAIVGHNMRIQVSSTKYILLGQYMQAYLYWIQACMDIYCIGLRCKLESNCRTLKQIFLSLPLHWPNVLSNVEVVENKIMLARATLDKVDVNIGLNSQAKKLFHLSLVDYHQTVVISILMKFLQLIG